MREMRKTNVTKPSFTRRIFWLYLGAGLLIFFAVGRGIMVGVGRDPGMFVSLENWVVDSQGNIISGSKRPLPFAWSQAEGLLGADYPRMVQGSELTLRHWILPFERSRYIVIEQRVRRPLALALVVAVATLAFLGSGTLATGLLVLYTQKKGREAETVVTRLKQGDLRARFHVTRLDEVGRTMISFNAMADEIEHLVERVRSAEARRTDMLRELAHDIRTPLTSLGYLFDTLCDPHTPLSSETIGEKLGMARGDLDYFKRLVEDLFLLAEAEDRSHTLPTEKIDPLHWLDSETERLRAQGRARGKTLQLDADIGETALIVGNPYLLKRLLGNALENALHYAKSSVKIIAHTVDNRLEIVVRDDGDGFRDETLKNFGERRTSRFIDSQATGKVSLGLGSVIMKKVAALQGGSVEAKNWRDPEGRIGGAEIQFVLPLAKSDAKAA